MNKLFRPSVDADLSCTPPIMAFNKINGISVGADLSALGSLHDIPLYLLKFIIGHRYM